MSVRTTLLLALLSVGINGDSQVYNNFSTQLGLNAIVDNNLHGAGVSTVDFDQNGWDDLTFCTDDAIIVYLNEQGIALSVEFPFEVDDNAKHPQWIDFDNDGDLDFWFTQMNAANKLYRNDGSDGFTDISVEVGLPQTPSPSFGASWADFDRDGDLDLYVCNYVYVAPDQFELYNHLYRNEAGLTLTDVTLLAGVSDGISLSFQSVWLDYDNDLWPDLYVINDLEHPNRLYHNLGDGTFADVSFASNTSIPLVDAMSASCGDYNNDGLEDIFVTNVANGSCVLLKNNGNGTFTNTAFSAGLSLGMLTWGASWMDFDLDKDLDLYVCENFYLSPNLPNPFMKNLGGVFDNVGSTTFSGDNSNSYSCAPLDWDGNGYPDLLVSNYFPEQPNLWISSGGNQPYIKINLEGIVSNSFGIGAKICCWSAGMFQIRYLRSGQDYLAQQTFTQHFGLGGSQIADSIIVTWPSGYVDKWIGLQSNQVYTLVEGSTQPTNLISPNGAVMCATDTLVLSVPEFDTYLWSTGDTTQQLQVSAPGSYFVTVGHSSGLSWMSIPVVVELDAPPDFTFSLQSPTCHNSLDGSIQVSGKLPGTLNWDDGSEEVLLDSIGSGSHLLSYLSLAGCFYSTFVILDGPAELVVEVNAFDADCHGHATGAIDWWADGGVPPYSVNWSDEAFDSLVAGIYLLEIVDSLGCTVGVETEIDEPEMLNYELINIDCGDENSVLLDLLISGGTTPYVVEWDGGIFGQSVSLDMAELPIAASITDNNGCSLETELFSCPTVVLESNTIVRIYPIPADEILVIETKETGIGFMIANMSGHVIDRGECGVGHELSVAHIPNGVYVLQLWSEKSKFYRLITILH
jgi:hypothetical protein